MSILTSEFWLAMSPILIAAAAIPFLISLLLWGVFYASHGGRLKVLTTCLDTMLKFSDSLVDSSMENLDRLEKSVDLNQVPNFALLWRRMRNQISNQYTNQLIPEAKSFFDADTLIVIPGGRNLLGELYISILTLSVLTILAPFTASYAIFGSLMPEAIFLGTLSAIMTGTIHLVYISENQRTYDNALTVLNRFYTTFDAVLPVAGALAGPALLLKATSENRIILEESTARMVAQFGESAEQITSKFSDFAEGGVLPALTAAVQAITDKHILPALIEFKNLSDQTMTKVIARQESGMAELAASFSDRLADTLEVRMTALASALGDINLQMAANTAKSEEQMYAFSLQYSALIEQVDAGLTHHMTASEEHAMQLMEKISNELGALTANTGTEFVAIAAALNQQFTTLLEAINSQLAANVTSLSDMMAGQKDTLDQSSDILIRAAELQSHAAASSQLMNDHVGSMAETMSKFQLQTDHFITEIMDFSVKNNATQLKMSEDINAAQLKLEESLESSMEKYAQMSELISGMMTDITERMNEAMAGAGREIALGINQVTAENAEAISNLTIQAQQLRDDYSTYFERTEDSTKAMLENLDYQMHGLMTTMTEGIGELLKDTVQENANTLSQYKDQTMDLLQSFEEQAMSISLYAKEINLDITDLTTGIKAAVADFTANIQEGVKLTIGEFDQGLAELTDRIAITVESISEAVEGLPTALSRK